MDLYRIILPGILQQNDSSEDDEAPLLEQDDLESTDEEEDNDREEEVVEEEEREENLEEEVVGDGDLAANVEENVSQSSSVKLQINGGSKMKKKKKKNKTEFDISLPARHLYLGELEEDGPANMEDEEARPTLPLLCIPSRVLFPGETLPMHINNPHMILMLRDASTKNKPVAVCTDLRLRHAPDHRPRPMQQELSEVGTTAEVVAFREEESQYYYGQCFVVKFLGRQRFKLLELHTRVNGLMDCRVEILPEQYLPPRPLHLFSCPSHVYASCHAKQLMARQPDCTTQTCIQLEQCRKRLQHPYISGSLSSVPSWVFAQYDTDYLREKLIMEQELKTFESDEFKSNRLPNEISSLSYWLARRLPTDEPGKLLLLSIDNPTLRLIQALQMLKKFTDLRCVNCHNVIAKKSHMFSMSVDGPVAAYVNPGGYVHDTLTVTETKGLRRQGSASTEHSWFPDYKWTILNCRGCGHHKGWCFEATKKNLVPAKFFGLTRAGLLLMSAEEQIDTG